ncbi:MAG: putative 4-mercaptohistidine N1-methyltransferase [Desulfocapsa sp.]|nr:MAG: putative 4-mercaptohistidine N1-methyltransferase [Desulfocapsa sp.]
MNPYETDELVTQYMEFHYGVSYFGVDNYPRKCAEHCLDLIQAEGVSTERALDLGCAVGRTTFELARGFNEVAGVDLSQRFIECAMQLKEQGFLSYSMITEGELVTARKAKLAELQLEAQSNKVQFFQEDACHLSPRHKQYNLIFAGNLIDRLENPKIFLKSIHHYLAPGGLLVMSSPYTLLEEYTPHENWLGGYTKDAKTVTVLDGIKEVLEPHFIMINKPIDVPFVIRETQRKFQHTLAELSSWKRIK